MLDMVPASPGTMVISDVRYKIPKEDPKIITLEEMCNVIRSYTLEIDSYVVTLRAMWIALYCINSGVCKCSHELAAAATVFMIKMDEDECYSTKQFVKILNNLLVYEYEVECLQIYMALPSIPKTFAEIVYEKIGLEYVEPELEYIIGDYTFYEYLLQDQDQVADIVIEKYTKYKMDSRMSDVEVEDKEDDDVTGDSDDDIFDDMGLNKSVEDNGDIVMVSFNTAFSLLPPPPSQPPSSPQ